MRRRAFLVAAGASAFGLPVALARGETVPVAGFLNSASAATYAFNAAACDAALEKATSERLGALVVEEDSLTYLERDRIIQYAAAHRLPAICGYRDYVLPGGLMSYGARLPELMQKVLQYNRSCCARTR